MSRKKKKKGARSGAETNLKKKRNARPGRDRDQIFALADNLLFALVLLILFLRGFLSGRTYPHYNHLFNIAVCVAALLWLTKSYRRGTLQVHDRLLTGFITIFALVCSATFIVSVNRGLTLRNIYDLAAYTLLFLVIANNFRDSGSIKAAIAAILSSALIINAYGIYQRYITLEQTRRHLEAVMEAGNQDMLFGLPLDPGMIYRLSSTRVFSTFLFPNSYALFLCFTGALTLGVIFGMRDEIKALLGKGESSAYTRIARWLLLPLFAISCILIPWNLWMTYSRGGWITAAGIIFIFGVAAIASARKVPPAKMVVIIFVAIILSISLVSTDAVSADKIEVREDTLLGRLGDQYSVSQRFTYWKAALEMVKEHPWLGVGWGAFEKAYPRYMILGGFPVKLAHNNYLQVWAETGIIGLNAFIGIWLVFLHRFWRRMRLQRPDKWIACGLGAAIVGFLINSNVEFGLYLPPIMYYVYAMLGLLVAMPPGSPGDGQAGEMPGEKKEPAAAQKVAQKQDVFEFRLSGSRAAAAILGVVVLAFLMFNSFMGMKIFMDVEDERNRAFPTKFAMEEGFSVDPARQQRVLARNIPALKKSISYFSLDSEAHHMLGDTKMRLSSMTGDARLLSEAAKHIERAAELSPMSPSIFQSLATIYWKMGNATAQPEMFEKALHAEMKAAENFPVNPGYHDKLRQIYKSLQMEDEAEEELKISNELKKHYKEY